MGDDAQPGRRIAFGEGHIQHTIPGGGGNGTYMIDQFGQTKDRHHPLASLGRLGAACSIALLMLTACSSDGTKSSDGTDSTITTTESATTTEAPSTTTVTTTTPTTSAAPETTDPNTTEIAVVDPSTLSTEELTAHLTAALAADTQAWVACAAQLPACDLTGLAATAASPQLEISAAIMQGGNTNGWSASNLESYRSQLESVEFSDDNHTALVTACTEDGIVVTDRSGALVTDRFSSNRTIWTFEWIDGTWKVTTGIQQALVVGQENTLCSF